MAAPFPSPTSKWHTTRYDSISPTRPELSARGKNVLITGGGTGIGAETARSFAAAGASRIALLGRREQPLLATKAAIEREFAGSTEVWVASVDVGDGGSAVEEAFAKFTADGKRKIDVLVSNAALTGPHDSVRSVDPDAYLAAINLNLRMALNTAQAFLRHAAPDAVAVEINSNAGHISFGDFFGSYTVAKLAVYRLWDTVALGNPGLSIFHLHPGVVRTAMNEEAGGADAVGFEDHVSLPGSFNVWLASPEARFLKGKYLWSNWDVDELKARAKEIESSRELNIDLVGWPFGQPDWKPTWNK